MSIQIFLRRTNRTLNFNGCFLSYQSYLSAAQIASCILKLYLRKPLSCFISWTMEWISCLVLCCGSLRVISLAHLGIRNWKHKRNCILIADKKIPTTFRTFPLWTDKIVGSSINCRSLGYLRPTKITISFFMIYSSFLKTLFFNNNSRSRQDLFPFFIFTSPVLINFVFRLGLLQ